MKIRSSLGGTEAGGLKLTSIMSTKVAGYTASAISLFAILSCLVYIPYLTSKVSDIRSSFDLKMDEFKVRQCSKLY